MNYMKRRHFIFFLFFLLAFLMAYAPIKALYESSSQSEYYSHIALIPLVSIYLVFQKRKLVFLEQENTDGRGAHSARNDRLAEISLLLAGALLFFVGRGVGAGLNQNDLTALVVLAAVLFLNGGFILAYGLPAFKAALFPLLFLIFMIPIPSALMDGFISLLQVGSTEFTNLLFMATGVPFLREGFVFHLPGMSIEVAKQCSGIRSSLALLITAILAGHLFLETGGRKVALAVAVVPITMFKNGIRIMILTLMGTYWDPRWLTESSLHRDGGILFFILALALMAPILYWLRRGK
ncbi:MAG: exosortase/archaeosortase family protein [bacterium]